MKEESKITKLLKNDGFKSILASLISIAIGLLVGLIVMIIISFMSEDSSISNAFQGILIMLKGPFNSTRSNYIISNTGNMIFYSVPLIFTGLSVAIAYKTGLFNIGAPGQYVMGIIGALLVALYIPTETRFQAILVWLLAVLVAAIFGALWGMIPGILKAFFNINEVIICIMTNWIAANIASWVFKYTTAIQSTEDTKGGYLTKVANNYTPKMGLDKLLPNSLIDGGIIIAIIVAIILYVVMNKTVFGYELKACGANKDASKYAGLNEKKNIILSIAIAGALAGVGAALYYLNPGIEYKYLAQYSSLPSYGFNGIASAFLANCNPIGVIFSSVLIRYLNIAGDSLVMIGFNRYAADVVVAAIIYMAGFSRIIKEALSKIHKKPKHDEIEKKEGE